MLEYLINYSIRNKLIVLLFTLGIVGFGTYALMNIPIGAVPDVTNNQVQVITTSTNLSTQDVEQFLTYPVELEMANLPGVTEIRSVSKFGLSVVTIVFEDDMGTYLPRQLIAEKIKSAQEKIPVGFGTPTMGPVSTGLGEIYQYILDVKPEFKDRYSIMELRSIQDWIVKRQLSGISGVVEVNSWGGFLKQYEVAVNPERLRSMNISISQVFTALEKNNSTAGGGYIEKGNKSYFIRGEGLIGSVEDIENIVVDNRGGTPIFVKDVATIGFGFANRFGAVTANGEGEKVLGQVMMLKDANSKAVIEAVKERVAEIQLSLPEGVYINGFLERSELIGKTTFTIAENLILGCLIVIFVVVLLLGNIRSGLVVASVIPLTLLFALSLMYLFGVDANLMSLGAIDFGIIIDGAVIIVEYIAFQITSQSEKILSLKADEKSKLIDTITFQSATKMMRSAVFGQLIIIIVFIPILSLSGVEGKMFKPMALTFTFALIGAMILCFTYVPVVASLFLKPSKSGKKNISARFISFLQKLYAPVISFALRQKAMVLSFALALLVAVGWLFSTMGGEFVPTLDEGDFVIQPVLKTGTSLSKTVETMTQIEQILKTFSEVEQVVTRIGAAEVPTDPMSMEETDVIIRLKPRKEWLLTKSKDELADKFKEALSVIPGLDYEFTQPIEMRFNELITGVRADLAIKIFGEDLEVLNRVALKIKKAIENVDGASDISVEKVAGLPQMSVQYNRAKIAKYGLNIEDVNDLVTMAFAGKTAGSVFEGEKQFDLVVRLDKAFRKDIDNIQNTSVTLPNGGQIPLSELAGITYTKGPAKISRDDTKRRIVVGINVRNRDLESVVADVQTIINREVKLPVGYSIAYGGQFENLRSATARLMVAVPIALVLIFILLYFAFSSFKEALMVYTAIPLSAVGGVLLLYFRGLPFSISAGVGFIALFGIAVLNGIVLIEHFKELKAHGMTDLKERIIIGTQQRLRPVLLTAAAAALGFLPMAISTSAGAEVQRPLATVVIGGLISATLLTLIVLPVLYFLLNAKQEKKTLSGSVTPLLILAAILLPSLGKTQIQFSSLEEATEFARQHNKRLQTENLSIERSQELTNTAHEMDKTGFYFGFDQNNIAEAGGALKIIGIQQNFRLPSVNKAQKKLLASKVLLDKQQYQITNFLLEKEVTKAWYKVIYWQNSVTNYEYLNSLYSQFSVAAARKYELGESNYLEKLTAATKQKEMAMQWQQGKENIALAYQELNHWIQTDTTLLITDTILSKLAVRQMIFQQHPSIQYFEEAKIVNEYSILVEQKKLLPEFTAEYFMGNAFQSPNKLYHGFQAGIQIPLWKGAMNSRIKAAELQSKIIDNQAQNYQTRLLSKQKQLLQELNKYEIAIQYYLEDGQLLSKELINTSTKAFQIGEIDFFQYIQSLESAKTIEINYLENLLLYNTTVLEINYLIVDE